MPWPVSSRVIEAQGGGVLVVRLHLPYRLPALAMNGVRLRWHIGGQLHWFVVEQEPAIGYAARKWNERVGRLI